VKRLIVAAVTCLVGAVAVRSFATPDLAISSPNRRIDVRVQITDRILYDVALDGRPLLSDSTLSLKVDQAILGLKPAIKTTRRSRVDRIIAPAVRQKAAQLHEAFNELRLEFDGGYAVAFRAYDEGAAYRWETALSATEVKVFAEEALFRFAGDWPAYYPKEESFFSHNEREYLPFKLKDIAPGTLASLPAVVEAEGAKIAIAESDLEEYPGLWLQGTAGNALVATFPGYPLEEKLERDRDLKVVRRADYIAVTKGTRTYPWRVLGIATRDGDLLTNPLVYLLAKPSQISDTSWIRPGKVAWDWWNANNIRGVSFKSGVNTETYKHYIDFAAKHGIEYVVLDEGWYELGDVLSVVPVMDIDALASHARSKNVGLILWVVWNTFADKLDAAFDKFESWGIRGLKIDFMQRDDQKVVDFYHRVCREAAKRKMLVDWHGGQKPALMTRTWPNLLTAEGVRGLEHSKWSVDAHPEHNVTLPFTRMFIGPMDYTPGAMRNASRNSFAPLFEEPMSLGTRCHQLAMYVVYESPLQMLADSPSSYDREPEAMEFLGPVPSVWDETRVLDARFGDYIVVARRSGRDWWIGAMTDWTPRELDVELSFLPDGRFALDSFEDGVNSDRAGSDYVRRKKDVDRALKTTIKLAPGGGWAARLSPADSST
jgi:alpha-glucosidase